MKIAKFVQEIQNSYMMLHFIL